jgi:hypothetical protein
VPIAACPHLVPVDDDTVAVEPPRSRHGKEGEVREGRRVNHVVAAAMAEQMPEHPETEDERRQNPTPAGRGVQPHPRADGAHDDPRHPGIRSLIPLAQCQVGHLMSVGGEALAKVAIPALGSADGVREETVVDQADAHRQPGEAQRGGAAEARL